MKIKAARELPDVAPDGLTFNSLDVKKAEEVFEKIKSACELPNVVKINSLDVQQAEEIFEKIRSVSERPSVVTLSSLSGGACAKPGKGRGAAAARPPAFPKL